MFLRAVLFLCFLSPAVLAADRDHDGLDDVVEEKLLERFRPRFRISKADCAQQPMALASGNGRPQIQDGKPVIYGQAFPVSIHGEKLVELHYYHLWRIDCGRWSHEWDVEHVSALIRDDRAIRWLAAAHQATVCDATHEAPARFIHAEKQGATVWISRGKHGSFLSEAACARGCGGDDCRDTEQLSYGRVVNLGEAEKPLSGAEWASWPGWTLREKMRSDFAGRALGSDGITYVASNLGPTQSVIASGLATLESLDLASVKVDNALTLSSQKLDHALLLSSQKVDDALTQSSFKVKGALQRARVWVKARYGN